MAEDVRAMMQETELAKVQAKLRKIHKLTRLK
jgi:hypothetical protein